MKLVRETLGIVVSAGVGTDLDFELGIIKKTGKQVIALYPTKTSLNHYLKVGTANKFLFRQLEFRSIALSVDGKPLKFFSGDGDRMATNSGSHSIGNSNEMLFEPIGLKEILKKSHV